MRQKVVIFLIKIVVADPHNYQWHYNNPQVVGEHSFVAEHKKIYSCINSPVKLRKTSENLKYRKWNTRQEELKDIKTKLSFVSLNHSNVKKNNVLFYIDLACTSR